MIFAKLYHLSTGYIEGTIPPRFSPDAVVPIPVCGSDSVALLDGRKTLHNQIADARTYVESLKRVKSGIVGFKIHQAASYADDNDRNALTDLIPCSATSAT